MTHDSANSPAGRNQEKADPKHVAFRHVVGTAIGTTIGVAAGSLSKAATGFGSGTLGGLVGLLTSCGFGDNIYDATVGNLDNTTGFASRVRMNRGIDSPRQR